MTEMNDGIEDTAATNPWQERDDIGFLRAFVRTVTVLIRDTRRVFEGTKPELGFGGPLLFGVLAGSLGQILESSVYFALRPLVSLLLSMDLPLVSPSALGGLGLTALPEWAISFLGCQVAILAIPLVVVVVGLFLLALASTVHMLLWLVGGLRSSEAGFKGTFATTCYATCASLAQVVPLLGDLIFVVVATAIQVVGLQVIHRTTFKRALTAAIGPLFLLAGFIAAVVFASAY